MAMFFRLGSRQLLNQVFKNEKMGMLSMVRPVSLQPQPVSPPKDVGHDERNMQLGRPQSPHLTIYELQLTSLLSITHRATGMMLAGYTILWGTGAVLLPESISTYLDSLQGMNSALLVGAKFSLALPLTYHFWNGIRHLLWDLGMFLSIREVYLTGYVMLAAAFSSAVVLSFM